jgi:hypothetical protein
VGDADASSLAPQSQASAAPKPAAARSALLSIASPAHGKHQRRPTEAPPLGRLRKWRSPASVSLAGGVRAWAQVGQLPAAQRFPARPKGRRECSWISATSRPARAGPCAKKRACRRAARSHQRSKFEAERIVRSYGHRLPIQISSTGFGIDLELLMQPAALPEPAHATSCMTCSSDAIMGRIYGGVRP